MRSAVQRRFSRSISLAAAHFAADGSADWAHATQRRRLGRLVFAMAASAGALHLIETAKMRSMPLTVSTLDTIEPAVTQTSSRFPRALCALMRSRSPVESMYGHSVRSATVFFPRTNAPRSAAPKARAHAMSMSLKTCTTSCVAALSRTATKSTAGSSLNHFNVRLPPRTFSRLDFQSAMIPPCHATFKLAITCGSRLRSNRRFQTGS